MMVGLALVLVAFAYLLFVCASIGLHGAALVGLRPDLSREDSHAAARKHRDRVLFTTDEPCAWAVPQLAQRSADPSAWSAVRIVPRRVTSPGFSGNASTCGATNEWQSSRKTIWTCTSSCSESFEGVASPVR